MISFVKQKIPTGVGIFKCDALQMRNSEFGMRRGRNPPRRMKSRWDEIQVELGRNRFATLSTVDTFRKPRLKKQASQGVPQATDEGYLYDSRGCRRGTTQDCAVYLDSESIKSQAASAATAPSAQAVAT